MHALLYKSTASTELVTQAEQRIGLVNVVQTITSFRGDHASPINGLALALKHGLH